MAIGDQMPIITIRVGHKEIMDDKTQYQLAELFRQIGGTILEVKQCHLEMAELLRVQVRPDPSRDLRGHYTLLIQEDGNIRLKAEGGQPDVFME